MIPKKLNKNNQNNQQQSLSIILFVLFFIIIYEGQGTDESFLRPLCGSQASVWASGKDQTPLPSKCSVVFIEDQILVSELPLTELCFLLINKTKC